STSPAGKPIPFLWKNVDIIIGVIVFDFFYLLCIKGKSICWFVIIQLNLAFTACCKRPISVFLWVIPTLRKRSHTRPGHNSGDGHRRGDSEAQNLPHFTFHYVIPS